MLSLGRRTPVFQPVRSSIVLAMVLALLLAACASDSESEDAFDDDDSGSEAAGDSAVAQTLVVALPQTPESADPEFGASDEGWSLPLMVYEFMTALPMQTDEHGVGTPDFGADLEPRLAESWEWSDDGLLLTYHLREGVKSEYGNELTAEDVIWSWQRAFELNAIGGWMFTPGNVTSGEAFSAIGDYTVQVQLDSPNILAPEMQAIYFAPGIYDTTELANHITDDDPWAQEWLSRNSATFGPYSISEFSEGEQVVLERNPNYYRTDDYDLDRIVLRAIPESANRMQLLRSGDAHVAIGLTARERSEVQESEGVKVMSVGGNNGLIYGLNNDFEPLDDPRVRQAIAYAMPIDDIISTVYFDAPGIELFEGYLPPDFPAQTGNWPYYPQNIDMAKQLLEEAGQTSFTLPLVLNNTRPEHVQAALSIRTALAEIGIEVEIQEQTAAQYQETFFGGTAPSVMVADSPWIPDPPYAPSLYYSTRDLSHANWINYANDEVDDLIEASRGSTDPDERRELARQAYEIVVDEAPWAFYIGVGFHMAMLEEVEGFNWRPNNLYYVHEMRLVE